MLKKKKSNLDGTIDFKFLLYSCIKNYYSENGYFKNMSKAAASKLYFQEKTLFCEFIKKTMEVIKNIQNFFKIILL